MEIKDLLLPVLNTGASFFFGGGSLHILTTVNLNNILVVTFEHMNIVHYEIGNAHKILTCHRHLFSLVLRDSTPRFGRRLVGRSVGRSHFTFLTGLR